MDKRELIAPEEAAVPAGYERVIPVVFAADDNYAPYAGAAICSIMRHASPESFYRVYVLHTGLGGGVAGRLEGMSGSGVTVRCLNVQPLLDSRGVTLYSHGHFTKETFYRFLIPEIFYVFPDVVYLDSDLIVARDIAEIIPADAGGAWVSAVRNPLTQKGAARVRDSFGIVPEDYFNAGVMVIHTGQWAAHKVVEQCFAMLAATPREKLMLLDQDILNAVCQGHVHFLNPGWNVLWHLIYTDSEELQGLFASAWGGLNGSFQILHYASGMKPWNRPELPLSAYFWEYTSRSPFYREILVRSREAAAAEREKTCRREMEQREKTCRREMEQREKTLNALHDAALRKTQEEMERETQRLTKELASQRAVVEKAKQQLEREKQENRLIRCSVSYRIGRAATWLPRKLRRILQGRKEV